VFTQDICSTLIMIEPSLLAQFNYTQDK
jgi:hypothetical protein